MTHLHTATRALGVPRQTGPYLDTGNRARRTRHYRLSTTGPCRGIRTARCFYDRDQPPPPKYIQVWVPVRPFEQPFFYEFFGLRNRVKRTPQCRLPTTGPCPGIRDWGYLVQLDHIGTKDRCIRLLRSVSRLRPFLTSWLSAIRPHWDYRSYESVDRDCHSAASDKAAAAVQLDRMRTKDRCIGY